MKTGIPEKPEEFEALRRSDQDESTAVESRVDTFDSKKKAKIKTATQSVQIQTRSSESRY